MTEIWNHREDSRKILLARTPEVFIARYMHEAKIQTGKGTASLNNEPHSTTTESRAFGIASGLKLSNQNWDFSGAGTIPMTCDRRRSIDVFSTEEEKGCRSLSHRLQLPMLPQQLAAPCSRLPSARLRGWLWLCAFWPCLTSHHGVKIASMTLTRLSGAQLVAGSA